MLRESPHSSSSLHVHGLGFAWEMCCVLELVRACANVIVTIGQLQQPHTLRNPYSRHEKTLHPLHACALGNMRFGQV